MSGLNAHSHWAYVTCPLCQERGVAEGIPRSRMDEKPILKPVRGIDFVMVEDLRFEANTFMDELEKL